MIEADPSRPVADRAWSAGDSVALLVVTVLAAVIRGYRLLSPNGLVFDEFYYGPDACRYVHESADLCGFGEFTYMHPPLGKWILSFGIQLFGPTRLGWRSAALVVGVVTVMVLFILARRAFRSTFAAVVAAGFLALDFMHIVNSRLAMLDVFATFFGTLAALFFVLDREDERAGVYRPWRLATGMAGGAAVACKWSGALVLLALIALSVWFDLRTRRLRLPAALLSVGVWLIVVPVIVYALTFVGRIHEPLLAAPWSEGSWIGELFDRQTRMANYHAGIKDILEGGVHPYSSPAWSWPLLKRPMSLYFAADGNVYSEVIAMGNPVVWWLAVPALVYLAAVATRVTRRLHDATVVVLFGAAFLPWILLPLGGPDPYIYYMVTAVPFMCLALGAVAARLERHRWGRAAAVAAVALALGAFSFFAPLLYATPMDRQAWLSRMWFRDCRRFEGETLAARLREAGLPIASGEITGVPEGEVIPTRTRASGWCWI